MLSHASLDAWNIKETDLPPLADGAAKLRFALHYAALAPSNHNTQPWRFLADGTSVMLRADRTRALAVVDPHHRELIIGCGAALFNLRVALERFGLGYKITLLPDQLDADLLAHVRVVHEGKNGFGIAALFDAITRRVTTREAFDPAPVPADMQDALVGAAIAEGVNAVSITGTPGRERIAELVARADHLQFRDARFRRELVRWIDPPRRGDGMPAYASGVSALLDFASPIASSAIRTFDLGKGAAAARCRLVEHSPMLLCIGTVEDNPSAWLAVGQALERVLLTAVRLGLSVSYLNQPIEVDELRDALRLEAAIDAFPQVLLRLGKGPSSAHTPRRSMSEMVTL
ncbi:Acg family FMN-binding oxidoreductase [Caballeronia grimmiae]|uniref:Acg family FMN-binding oxidoreductase n=1 Tax=Caballeronia grimmiae TaxID=1071679 RepID=UPI0038BB127E